MNNDIGLTGVLLVLDAHPGGIVYRDLIPEYVKIVRTIYEGLITFALILVLFV